MYREIRKRFTGEMDKNGRFGYSADLGQREDHRSEDARDATETDQGAGVKVR